MKNKKVKKRYIDDLYESRREGDFYAGDGKSHRPKKDIVIKRGHIILSIVMVLVVTWAIGFLIKPEKQDKLVSEGQIAGASFQSDTQNNPNSVVNQTEKQSPWFSVSSAGKLYFHPEYFEGSHLVIPKRFNNEVIERLDGPSFSVKNTDITQLTIHEGVKAIEEGAFSKFIALRTVNLSATLQRVGADCFSGTPWYKENTSEFLVVGKGVLIKYNGNDDVISIPESVSAIDGSVFQGADCKTIIVPDGTTYIGAKTFKNCGAEEIVIPDSVQFVERDAFENCKWLDSKDDKFVIEGAGVLLKCNSEESTLRIPDEVVTISGFNPGEKGKDMTLVLGPKVSKIADLEALGNVKAFKVDYRNPSLIAKSGVLYSADGSTLYRYPTYKGGTVFYMADKTLKIGNNAFSGSDIKTVELYDGLLVIGNEAFKNCKNLIRISVPDTVTELGTHVFEGCEKLEDATVSESIKALPHGTFKDCKGLKSVALSEGLVAISPNSFKGCDSFKYFYVTKNVARISGLAFDENVEFDVDSSNKFYKIKDGKLKDIEGINQTVSELIGTGDEKTPF